MPLLKGVNKHDIDDIFQNTLLSFCKFKDFDDSRNCLMPFLNKSIKKRSYDFFRKKHAKKRYHENSNIVLSEEKENSHCFKNDSKSVLDEMIKKEDSYILKNLFYEALNELPEKEKNMLIEIVFFNHNYQLYSLYKKRKIPYLKSAIFRTRQKLKKILNNRIIE